MARPLRFQDAVLWYHVTNRGNNREDVFVDDEDCRRFLDVLGASAALFGVEVHTCVIMTNHYLLLVRTPDANLSRLMQHAQERISTRREARQAALSLLTRHSRRTATNHALTEAQGHGDNHRDHDMTAPMS